MAGSSSDPTSLVQAACDAARASEPGQASGAVTQSMAQIRRILYPERPEEGRQAGQELAAAVQKSDLLALLLERLPGLEFECRKDVAHVFANMLRRQFDGELSAVAWLEGSPQLLLQLLHGCDEPDVTLNYGSMLRECVRHERLAALLLAEPDTFHVLFRNVESPHFDVASDAWATTKDLLTRHKGLVAEHLDGHFTEFFEQFALLVRSENYVTKRQSLKLLGELLLDRANFPVMSRYIASVENLKAIMIMLLDPSAAIQYEAFHVFKIFVANPRKHEQVLDVLLRNKEKMLSFLADFLKSREVQDENFRDEKAFLLEEIKRF